jgi:hypothetical protein
VPPTGTEAKDVVRVVGPTVGEPVIVTVNGPAGDDDPREPMVIPERPNMSCATTTLPRRKPRRIAIAPISALMSRRKEKSTCRNMAIFNQLREANFESRFSDMARHVSVSMHSPGRSAQRGLKNRCTRPPGVSPGEYGTGWSLSLC